MRDLFKSRPVARIKALTDADQPGTFEAIVSVFNNKDADGEVVKPGAFVATLAEGAKPIVYSHDWLSVPIGQTLEARETPEGLYVKGRLFVADDEDHQQARQVYAAMRGGALNEFSFGGRVTSETRVEQEDGSVVWELNTIDLVEYGPCLKGSNPKTHLLAVKSAMNAGVMSVAEACKTLGLEEAPAATDAPAEVENDDTTSAPETAPETEDPTPGVETSPAPPATDAPAPEVDVDGPQEVTNEGRALRSLLGLAADAADAEVLTALGEHTPTPSLPDGGGDPQLTDDAREAVAGLLLP